MYNTTIYAICRFMLVLFLVLLLILNIYNSVLLRHYYHKIPTHHDLWATWLALNYILIIIGVIGEFL